MIAPAFNPIVRLVVQPIPDGLTLRGLGAHQIFNGEYDVIGSYEVITLCGSTRFKDHFVDQQKRLTLEGKIVISVGLFGHSGDAITDEQKIMLDDMHKAKINMADVIFVINPNGYIGESTRSEIDYAEKCGKRVLYLEA